MDNNIIQAAQTKVQQYKRQAAITRTIAAALDGAYISRAIVPQVAALPGVGRVLYGIEQYGRRWRYVTVDGLIIYLATQDEPHLQRAVLDTRADELDAHAARIQAALETYASDCAQLNELEPYVKELRGRIDIVRDAARNANTCL